MNVSNSSSESKCVDCPETTCSTRPSIGPRATLLLVRNCTTNARWTDKGAFPSCCCGILSRHLRIACGITYALYKENTATQTENHRTILGLLWDYSRTQRGRKMQINQEVTFGHYRFDPQTKQLWRAKQEVRLTWKALVVLGYLLDRASQVVTKDELFQTVWPDTVVSDAALTSCIQELREALHDNARKPRYIETLYRRGFRFLGEVASSQHSVVSSPPSSPQSSVFSTPSWLDANLTLPSSTSA